MRMILRMPAPVFGTVGTGLAIGMNKSRAIPRYLPWGVPAVVGALWFIWPAVDEEFKVSIGMAKDPAAAAAAAAPAEIQLDEEATEKVLKAHRADDHDDEEEEEPLTAAQVEAIAKIESGDFTPLEEEWDNFLEKAIRPGEDDDDDDDDDEEEEEEEEEEEKDDDDDDDDE
jgi:hypothetical protein